jgi:hypothetical protein
MIWLLSDDYSMAAKQQITNERLLQLIHKHGGIINSIASHVNLSRQAIWKRINADTELKEAMLQARESMVDDAEAALREAVTAKEPWAVKLVVTTLGRDRGYSRNINLTGSVESTGVVHILKLPDNGRSNS